MSSTETVASNPLDSYRCRATFDPSALELYLQGEEVVAYKRQIWDTIAKDPLFAEPVTTSELGLSEKRALNWRRVKRLHEYDFLTDDDFLRCPAKSLALRVSSIMTFDASLSIAYSLNKEVCTCRYLLYVRIGILIGYLCYH